MRAVTVLAMVCAAVLAVAGVARAEPRAYRGPHPVDDAGHWHPDETVHVHEQLAVGLDAFADVDGVLVFLGDPVAYGWTGDVFAYRGAHPLPARVGGYCGIRGEHRHTFAPEGSYRRDDTGAYAFVGAMRGGVPTYVPGRLAPDVVPHAAVAVAAPAPMLLGGGEVWGGAICPLGSVAHAAITADGVAAYACVPIDVVAVAPRPARRRDRPAIGPADAPAAPTVRAPGPAADRAAVVVRRRPARRLP